MSRGQPGRRRTSAPRIETLSRRRDSELIVHRSLAGALIAASAIAGVLAVMAAPAAQQARPAARPYVLPRTPHGHPDLQGIWQTANSAAWDIQDHPARLGVPAGQG